MVYKFRVILDVKEDVFRDIIIQGEATLEDLHNVINQSFGFAGDEMASFYLTDSMVVSSIKRISPLSDTSKRVISSP